MRTSLNCLPYVIALASCSSPPRPPTVDESHKRPANAAVAVELQSCRSELQNTRIMALEDARAAQASGSTVARLLQQQAALPAGPAAAVPANRILTVQFAYGSARIALSDPEAKTLADLARSAPLIVLRGRTDGTTDAAAESRIARQRAEAVRALLLQAGIDATRIRTTWQPAGDPVADNGSPAGRALNRRVEIEIYRARPQVIALGAPAPAAGAAAAD